MVKKIELVKAKTFELDPNKFYMAFLNFPKSGLTIEDIARIRVPQASINFVWVLTTHDPNDVIEIIEVST